LNVLEGLVLIGFITLVMLNYIEAKLVDVAKSLFSFNTLLVDVLMTNFILTELVMVQTYLVVNEEETPIQVLLLLKYIPLAVGGVIMI
jgi:hypothetical protein